jgi:hypothetical protein
MNVPSGVPSLQWLLKDVIDPAVKLPLVKFRLLGSLDPPADTTC